MLENVITGLRTVATTLVWSLVLTALSVFLYVCIKWLQDYLGRGKTTRSRFEDLRNVMVMLPFVWMVMNFSSDTNYIADTMFGFWLPFVIVCIFVLGLGELILPVWQDAKRKGTNAVGRKVKR